MIFLREHSTSVLHGVLSILCLLLIVFIFTYNFTYTCLLSIFYYNVFPGELLFWGNFTRLLSG